MVRPKQVLSPTKEAVIKHKMNGLAAKFDQDLRDLEMAKRAYSADVVAQMTAEFKKLLPQDVLDMQVTDFVRHMERLGYEEDEDEEENTIIATTYGGVQTSNMTMDAKTPNSHIPHPSYYKEMKMADGLHMKIPSCITPRVSGKVQKPRASRFGEILFSVRGTPVMNTVSAANMVDAKKQEAIVRSLLQQEDALLTPETRKIIGKLKQLVHDRKDEGNGKENRKG